VNELSGRESSPAERARDEGILASATCCPSGELLTLMGRSFRNKLSKDMTFPHSKFRKDHYRKEDKPNSGGVVWKFFKRTINITEYRNAKDDVNRAGNRTFGGHYSFIQSLSIENLLHTFFNP
jgi:hypothetical protein